MARLFAERAAALRVLAMTVAMLVGASNAVSAEWQYNSTTDKMTEQTTRFAMLRSDNSLALDFPYGGRNHGQITVRQHPQYGLDVVVQIDKGQIQCGLDDCRLAVRINGAKPTRITFARAADGDSSMVFARTARPLVNQLLKAETVMIQLPMYRAGNQVLEFTADKPLEWQLPPVKKSRR